MEQSSWIALLSIASSGIGVGVGCYVAVRVELAKVNERVIANAARTNEAIERANQAHARIDQLLGASH